jgi:hypothetical protein
MRFLFGLIIGAVATVMLAPKLASLSPAALEPIQDTLLAVASRVSASGDRDDGPNGDPDPALPELARDVLPLPKLAASPAVTTTPTESDRPAPAPILTELSQEQSFWVPFRSEVSARGFAGKLSEQLARQFQVLRSGPGQYLVVFGYHSEAERAEVLAEIHALTGYTQL